MVRKGMNEREIVKFFSALADETRLKILVSLMNSPKTVTEIHLDVGRNLTLSAISHQLKILSNADVVESEKVGREKKYSSSGKFCMCMIRDAISHFGGKNKK